MNAPRITRAIVALLAAYLLSAPVAHAQRTGRVSGTVVDASGAYISNASVTLFSDDFIRAAAADQYGRFDFQDLPESLISLAVSSPGFKAVTMTDIQTSERGLFEIILQPGECTQCVTVTTFCRSVVPFVPIAPPKVFYQERLDDVSVAGNVRDALRGPLNQSTVILANPTTGLTYVTMTDDKGEFQFRDTDPGRYQLKATRDNYSQSSTVLWVARENLTKINRVDLLPAENYRKICAPDLTSESSPLRSDLIPPR